MCFDSLWKIYIARDSRDSFIPVEKSCHNVISRDLVARDFVTSLLNNQPNPNLADPIPVVFCLTASATEPRLTVKLVPRVLKRRMWTSALSKWPSDASLWLLYNGLLKWLTERLVWLWSALTVTEKKILFSCCCLFGCTDEWLMSHHCSSCLSSNRREHRPLLVWFSGALHRRMQDVHNGHTAVGFVLTTGWGRVHYSFSKPQTEIDF